MEIEYEAKFLDINKDKVRKKLTSSGAKLIRTEFLQKRVVFDLPSGHAIKGGWLRVRDEGDKITMSLKIVDGDNIHDQKEICLTVDDFKQAEELLKTIGCRKKSYQETKRELWRLGKVEITIDEWPFLEPFVEIEAKSEKEVRDVAKKLGFDYSKAVFGAVDVPLEKKYKISKAYIDQIPLIVFEGKNPFLKK